MTSQLSTLFRIPERSEATPGLWNAVYDQIDANFTAVDITNSTSTLSIGADLWLAGAELIGEQPSYSTRAALKIAVRSDTSDYIYFEDSSAAKSDYLLGSRVGGTADGLNLYDVSGDTMLVSFSKQSIRFFQKVVGPVFDVGGALAKTYNAATFGTALDSNESRIQAAINQAKIDNFQRVYVPASMYTFSGSSISVIAGIQMVREGGAWDVHDVVAYGINGDGTTDITRSLQSVESFVRRKGETIFFPPGTYVVNTAYDGTVGARANLLSIRTSGTWDFGSATLKYGSSTNLGVGSDGGGLGTLNVLSDDVDIRGTLDGNDKSNFLLAFQSQRSNIALDVKIINSRITSGSWAALAYAASVDVTGTAIGGLRAINVSGFLNRPNCPFMTTAGTVDSFGNVAAVLVGGTQVVANASSLAFVLGGPNSQFNSYFAGIGNVGVMSTAKFREGNDHWFDVVAHELGANVIELYGHDIFDNNFGMSTTSGLDYLSLAIKDDTVANWYHYNAFSSSTIPPNVQIRGGKTAGKGLIRLDGQSFWTNGSSGTPSYAFSSETSLGFYRSANSTIAQSFGTFQVDYISTQSLVPISGGTVSVASSLRVVANSANQLYLQSAGAGNYELRQTGGQLQLVDAGAFVLTATGAGNHMFFQTNASGTNRMFIRSGGTVEVNNSLWVNSGISVGTGGTIIPAMSSMSSLIAAFVVQGSASSFTVVTWAAAQPGDQILTTVMQSGAVSSLSSGLVLHSHCTQAGQIELRLSNVSTLAQNQSSRTYLFTRISPF